MEFPPKTTNQQSNPFYSAVSPQYSNAFDNLNIEFSMLVEESVGEREGNVSNSSLMSVCCLRENEIFSRAVCGFSVNLTGFSANS